MSIQQIGSSGSETNILFSSGLSSSILQQHVEFIDAMKCLNRFSSTTASERVHGVFNSRCFIVNGES